MGKKTKISKLTLNDLLQEREAKCERCDRTEWLTIDHIVPIALLKSFGLSIEEMYEKELLTILCRPCNSLKGCNLDMADYRTVIILKKLLQRFEKDSDLIS